MNKKNNKIIKKSIISICLGIAILTLSCYHDDGDARVTIRFKGNFLSSNAKPQKHFIDKILELFSTPAYAWDNSHDTLYLTISGPNIEEMGPIPLRSQQYSVTLPAVDNVTFKVLAYYNEIESYTWGASTTVSLKPGNQDIVITMMPMTQITGESDYYFFFDVVDSPHCSGYKIYRSTNNPDGNYKCIETINNMDADGFQQNPEADSLDPYKNYYYYRISVLNENGVEGLLSETYFEWHCVP